MKWRTVGLFVVVFMGAGTVQAVVTDLQNNKTTVAAAFEDNIQSTTSATFVDMNPPLQVTVNTANGAILLMRFSASAFCDDGADGNAVCSGFVQILVDGTPVEPGGSAITFNESTLGLGSFGVGIDRALAGLAKGPHVVEVQIRSGSAGDQFSVDQAHLTAMSFK